jgi:very-short-patch-repair endonuclease
MVPRVTDERLSNARRLRREMTAPETMLWRSLRNRGIAAKFRRQVPIGPYVADFACVAARLVVELDGRPHESAQRQEHDRYRDAWLARQGWRVLRVPNDIVIGGGDIVIGRIRAALAPHVPSSDPC